MSLSMSTGGAAVSITDIAQIITGVASVIAALIALRIATKQNHLSVAANRAYVMVSEFSVEVLSAGKPAICDFKFACFGVTPALDVKVGAMYYLVPPDQVDKVKDITPLPTAAAMSMPPGQNPALQLRGQGIVPLVPTVEQMEDLKSGRLLFVALVVCEYKDMSGENRRTHQRGYLPTAKLIPVGKVSLTIGKDGLSIS